MSVSLPHLGLTVAPGGVSQIRITLDIAAEGVVRLVGVSLPSVVITGATFYLLQEDGASRIILENGSGFLQLESAP